MQLPWDEHFYEIVVPAWRTFNAASARLSDAERSENPVFIKYASYDALREGGAATFYVHHFTEVVLRAIPPWLPPSITSIGNTTRRLRKKQLRETRSWLENHCTSLRSGIHIADVSLLGAVADALKHSVLSSDERDVSASDQVLVVAKDYGEGLYGEGMMGGLEVRVKAKSGSRALSGILQNVVDAWHRVAGLPLP
jgi:hypothetical protein